MGVKDKKHDFSRGTCVALFQCSNTQPRDNQNVGVYAAEMGYLWRCRCAGVEVSGCQRCENKVRFYMINFPRWHTYNDDDAFMLFISHSAPPTVLKVEYAPTNWQSRQFLFKSSNTSLFVFLLITHGNLKFWINIKPQRKRIRSWLYTERDFIGRNVKIAVKVNIVSVITQGEPTGEVWPYPWHTPLIQFATREDPG